MGDAGAQHQGTGVTQILRVQIHQSDTFAGGGLAPRIVIVPGPHLGTAGGGAHGRP